MIRKLGKIAVVGAIHVDRLAHASRPVKPDTSTPGEIFQKAGGVAANIAQALARLDCAPLLIGSVGNDSDGTWVCDLLQSAGVDTSAIARSSRFQTGSYLALHDVDGSLYAAIASSEITDHALPLDHPLPHQLLDAGIWVCETNLAEEQLLRLAAQKGERLLAADTVSIAKAPRLLPILDQLDLLFTNRSEAETLTGLSQNEPTEALAQSLQIRSNGSVVITDGPSPLTIAGPEGIISLPVPPAQLKDVTGAGDAFIAGFLKSVSKGSDIKASAIMGLAASAITVEQEGAAPPALNSNAIAQKASQIKAFYEQSQTTTTA
ncbi:kinase [Rhodobacteraceae bacterium RKSG542]|uniref:PfkB family carbohydrate kinase n=1 Tax=Pseudovibrio flavus TaxID=2529854 RepID=UPI0012BBB37C|nr:PfkB family carbohydrate kinase [Pseudovibrio flavus]MTI19290.1 kinase [Pseudovibrio flavus]